MDARFAENLVRRWQTVKSVVLGSDHCLEKLSEVRNLSVTSSLTPLSFFLFLVDIVCNKYTIADISLKYSLGIKQLNF